jgi:hypothetical protein
MSVYELVCLSVGWIVACQNNALETVLAYFLRQSIQAFLVHGVTRLIRVIVQQGDADAWVAAGVLERSEVLLGWEVSEDVPLLRVGYSCEVAAIKPTFSLWHGCGALFLCRCLVAARAWCYGSGSLV